MKVRIALNLVNFIIIFRSSSYFSCIPSSGVCVVADSNVYCYYTLHPALLYKLRSQKIRMLSALFYRLNPAAVIKYCAKKPVASRTTLNLTPNVTLNCFFLDFECNSESAFFVEK